MRKRWSSPINLVHVTEFLGQVRDGANPRLRQLIWAVEVEEAMDVMEITGFDLSSGASI